MPSVVSNVRRGCRAKSSRTKSVTVKDGEDDKRTFGPNPGAPGRNAKPCPPGQKRELVAQQVCRSIDKKREGCDTIESVVRL